MITYNTVYSTRKPSNIEMTDTKVYIAENIIATSYLNEDGNSVDSWQYTLKEYTKDEYLHMAFAKIDELEEELAAAKVLLGVE